MKRSQRVLMIAGICCAGGAFGLAQAAPAHVSVKPVAPAGEAPHLAHADINAPVLSLQEFISRVSSLTERTLEASAGFGPVGSCALRVAGARLQVKYDTQTKPCAGASPLELAGLSPNEVKVPQLAKQNDSSQVSVPQAGAKIISEQAYSGAGADTKVKPADAGSAAARDIMAEKLKQAIEAAMAQYDPSTAKKQPGEGALSWTAGQQSGQSNGATVSGTLDVQVKTSH